ncbi:MAG: tRNA pseudouridine(55) synthase TruB [Bacteroidetes bacterium SW_9_63_38]|nr:MAG: tRNA pseudouridine(55) synthase TruB [Bacteroidetes bacterium SW_9_63_38]
MYQASSLPLSLNDGAVLLVDKPTGATSFDVVKAVRGRAGPSKVGHAGTLDPMATGLLIILVARPATRLQEAFMHLPKTYEGTMRLGERTPSLDTETEVEEHVDVSHLSFEDIAAVRDSFTGQINQTPPMYSAVEVDGEPLYKKARRGETVERAPRQVRIDRFELRDWTPPDLTFAIDCSKGTYIRSLARDVGAALDVGAHLAALRRTAIGEHRAADAWPLPALKDALSEATTDPDES